MLMMMVLHKTSGNDDAGDGDDGDGDGDDGDSDGDVAAQGTNPI